MAQKPSPMTSKPLNCEDPHFFSSHLSPNDENHRGLDLTAFLGDFLVSHDAENSELTGSALSLAQSLRKDRKRNAAGSRKVPKGAE